MCIIFNVLCQSLTHPFENWVKEVCARPEAVPLLNQNLHLS